MASAMCRSSSTSATTSAKSPTRRAVPQLCQSRWRSIPGPPSSTARSDSRALPRRPAWRGADRRRVWAAERHSDLDYICAGINHQTWFIDLRLKGRRIGKRRTARRLRAASCLFQAGKGSHRCAAALRRLFDREQRPPFGIPALVPQAARRDRPLDRHVRLDPRRDRRLSAPCHGDPQLVRDRLSQLPRRRRHVRSILRGARASTRAISSRRWKRAGSTAAISMSATRA